jgi:hypothetical protein
MILISEGLRKFLALPLAEKLLLLEALLYLGTLPRLPAGSPHIARRLGDSFAGCRALRRPTCLGAPDRSGCGIMHGTRGKVPVWRKPWRKIISGGVVYPAGFPSGARMPRQLTAHARLQAGNTTLLEPLRAFTVLSTFTNPEVKSGLAVLNVAW